MFGEDEKDSSTYGKWEMQVTPTLEYVMLEREGATPKTIVMDQNSKVS